jgi:predicted dehydrogenase
MIVSGEYGRLRRIEQLHRRGAWLEEGNGIWHTRPELSGGHFLMHPIHEIDIMRSFAGEIVEVQTISGPNVLPHYRIPDNICCHLFFESGATAVLLMTHTMSADSNDPKKWSSLGHKMTMTLTFEKSSVQMDFIRARLLVNRFEEFPQGSGGVKVVHDRVEDYSAGDIHEAHNIAGMRRDFIRRCAMGEAPLQDPVDAWKSHMVCIAAEESAVNGGKRMRMDYSLPENLR